MNRLVIAAVAVPALLLAACETEGEAGPVSPAATPVAPSPTAASEPTLEPTPTPEGNAEQLAFVSVDGAIWVVNADGSGLTKFADDACNGRLHSTAAVAFTWSPTGENLAIGCQNSDYSWSLVVLDENGRSISGADGLMGVPVQWSPDGTKVAYQTGQSPTSPSATYTVRMVDLIALEDRMLAENAWLLDWTSPGQILLGLNVEDAGLGVSYEAHLLDLASGQNEPMTRFDDMRQFWLSSDATKAVVLAVPADREEGGYDLAVYDLETGSESPIPRSMIGFPSSGIFPTHVVFSADSSEVFWVDAASEPAAVNRAKTDGSAAVRMGTVPSIRAEISQRGLVAYVSVGAANLPGKVVVADLERNTRIEVGEARGPVMAWRPIP